MPLVSNVSSSQPDGLLDLPFRLSKPASVLQKDMGWVGRGSTSPLEILADLVGSNPRTQVVTVTANFELGSGAGFVKYLYDKKSQNLLKMERHALPGLEATYRWSLSMDVEPTALSEEALWGLESRIRHVTSKPTSARTTVPLRYDSKPNLVAWP